MGDFKLSGGCQCDAVRYRITAPTAKTFHCHCSICRKNHGAMFGTISMLARDQLIIDEGADNLGDFESSAGVHRKFCRTCGSPLFGFFDNNPDLACISTGTLDDGAHPGHGDDSIRHIFVGSKVPWYEIADGLPQHEEF